MNTLLRPLARPWALREVNDPLRITIKQSLLGDLSLTFGGFPCPDDVVIFFYILD